MTALTLDSRAFTIAVPALSSKVYTSTYFGLCGAPGQMSTEAWLEVA